MEEIVYPYKVEAQLENLELETSSNKELIDLDNLELQDSELFKKVM